MQGPKKNRAIGDEQFQEKSDRKEITKDSSARNKGQDHRCLDSLSEEGQDQGVSLCKGSIGQGCICRGTGWGLRCLQDKDQGTTYIIRREIDMHY